MDVSTGVFGDDNKHINAKEKVKLSRGGVWNIILQTSDHALWLHSLSKMRMQSVSSVRDYHLFIIPVYPKCRTEVKRSHLSFYIYSIQKYYTEILWTCHKIFIITVYHFSFGKPVVEWIPPDITRTCYVYPVNFHSRDIHRNDHIKWAVRIYF